MTEDQAGTLRDRLTRQGEDALGKLAQELLENPLVTGAIARAFDAREKATQAQEAAMGALNLPSAADIERLTRRLRSVSQRLEGIEDAVDRLDRRLEAMQLETASAAAARSTGGGDDRLSVIERQLGKVVAELSHLTSHLDAGPAAMPREQERLQVEHVEPPRGDAA